MDENFYDENNKEITAEEFNRKRIELLNLRLEKVKSKGIVINPSELFSLIEKRREH